ncbi:hypothetical protein SDC9_200615 [bioreactor metagenome]|uniref:Uncharacterized protein n=1 Tax=bioreactor metagenome TaxID=1076179 RepID=A0A645IQ01_9ZZZZ
MASRLSLTHASGEIGLIQPTATYLSWTSTKSCTILTTLVATVPESCSLVASAVSEIGSVV